MVEINRTEMLSLWLLEVLVVVLLSTNGEQVRLEWSVGVVSLRRYEDGTVRRAQKQT